MEIYKSFELSSQGVNVSDSNVLIGSAETV